MIWKLLRQDPAHRTYLASIPISLFTGLFLGAVASQRVAWLGPGSLDLQDKKIALILFVVWIELVTFSIFAHALARSSRLSLTLPIPARKLWVTRIASVLAAGLIPLGLLTLLASLHHSVFLEWAGPDRRILLLGARTGAALILTILLLQIPYPSLYRIQARPGYVWYAFLVGGAMLTVLIFIPHSPGYAWLLFAPSPILGSWIFFHLPAGFLVAPRNPEWSPGRDGPAKPRAADAVLSWRGTALPVLEPERSPPRGGPFLHLTLFRVLMNHPMTWLFLPVALFYGDRMVFAYRGGWELAPYFLMIPLWTAALIFFAIIRMFQVDPLPISRRWMFAQAFLPVGLAIALGVGFGWLEFSRKGHPERMVRQSNHRVLVPQDTWEITWDGRVPAVTSPWGESHVPKAYPLYRGSPIAVYNPFERGESSSERFAEFQLARAVEAIHGVPAATLRTMGGRAPDVPSTPSDSRCCLALVGTEYLGSPGRHRTLATTVLLLILVSTGMFALGLQQFRVSAPLHVFPWLLQGLVGPLALFGLLAVVGHATGFTSFRALGTTPMVLVRKLGEMIPLPVAGIWILAAISLLLGYLAIQSRFLKIEAPLGLMKNQLAEKF